MWRLLLGLVFTIPAPALAGPDLVVTLRRAVALQSAELRVGDLVDRREQLPAPVAAMVVTHLPRNGEVIELSQSQVAALLRRRVPGLRPIASPGALVRIALAFPAAKAGPPAQCFAAAGGVAAGAPLTISDVTAVACRNASVARLRYSGGLAIAGVDVSAGAYLGRLATLPDRAIGKGALLTLRSTSGPATIERPVIALEPAPTGGKLFVRTASGEVFATTLALSGEGPAR